MLVQAGGESKIKLRISGPAYRKFTKAKEENFPFGGPAGEPYFPDARSGSFLIAGRTQAGSFDTVF
jgi:hypothetical protein